jgi:DNA excision repair protein ERCC-2
MMDDIYSALSDNKSILVNAPTGTGKTDAAVAAALTYAKKNGLDVMFLTPKTSQHKIVIESLLGINKRFGINLKYVDVVGKRNLCVNAHVNNLEGETFYKKCEDLVKNKKCMFYTNSKDTDSVAKLLNQSLLGHNALFDEAHKKGICAYEAVTALAKDSRVIIADYAHILNPYVRESFLKKISHNLENTILIWDEAHNIVNAASSYLSTSISTRSIERGAAELQTINSSIDIGYIAFVLEEIAKRKLIDDMTEAFIEPIDLPRTLTENINKVAEDLEKASLEYISKTDSKRSSLIHIANFLRSLQSKDESTVWIISRHINGIKVAITSLYPSKSIDVVNGAYANIFMSGTLMPLGMYKELFGVEDSNSVSYASPFPKENKLSLIDQDTSTKYEDRSNESYSKMAEKIELIKAHTIGNVVVFFPSFSVLKGVYRNMHRTVEYLQRSEMKSFEIEKLLSEFKGSDDSLLFAVMGGSLSEGIDYKNNIIKGIIIVGIPLEKPNLELNARIEYMNKKFGKGSEYAYIIPGVVKAVQAAGRAIRDGKDKAFVLLMDKRYGWRMYRSIINNFIEISDEKDYLTAIKHFNEGRSGTLHNENKSML